MAPTSHITVGARITVAIRVVQGQWGAANFADAMADVAAHGRVVVLGSEQAIDAANAERPGLFSVSQVI